MDVRMLGSGRPFAFEVQNQRSGPPSPVRGAATAGLSTPPRHPTSDSPLSGSRVLLRIPSPHTGGVRGHRGCARCRGRRSHHPLAAAGDQGAA